MNQTRSLLIAAILAVACVGSCARRDGGDDNKSRTERLKERAVLAKEKADQAKGTALKAKVAADRAKEALDRAKERHQASDNGQ